MKIRQLKIVKIRQPGKNHNGLHIFCFCFSLGSAHARPPVLARSHIVIAVGTSCSVDSARHTDRAASRGLSPQARTERNRETRLPYIARTWIQRSYGTTMPLSRSFGGRPICHCGCARWRYSLWCRQPQPRCQPCCGETCAVCVLCA